MNLNNLKDLPEEYKKYLKIPISEYDRELAERSLKEFIIQAWNIVEPSNDFISGWHIDAIAEHLQAVSEKKISKLIINIPPRHMKSLLTCVFWPAWEWINNPHSRFLYMSYAEKLSSRDSRKCRYIIQSKWYQDLWGHVFKILGDQNAKLRYDTDAMGYRIATSVGGVATGEGGDYVICDDPHSVLDALSDTKRNSCITWWDQTMPTRGDQTVSAKVLIMQRLHAKDLSGHLLAKEIGYEHLCLPAEYEGKNRCITSLKFKDPRTEINELLHPNRFNRKAFDALKSEMVPYSVAGQLQQRPTPLEGGLLDFNWFRSYKFLPDKSQQLSMMQAWDTAQKPDELLNDPWVCFTWVICYNGFYLVDVVRRWMNYPTGKRAVISNALKWNPDVILIEDKTTGSSLLQELPLEEIGNNGTIQMFPFPLLPILPINDKITRMAVESPMVESGKVFIPEVTSWLGDFETEISAFPNSDTKDQVDTLSMSLKYLKHRLSFMNTEPMTVGKAVVGEEYKSIWDEIGGVGNDRKTFDGGIV